MELLPNTFEDFNKTEKEKEIQERMKLGLQTLEKMNGAFKTLTEDIINGKLGESQTCPVMERANQILKEWIESLNDFKLYNYQKRVADLAANRLPSTVSDGDGKD